MNERETSVKKEADNQAESKLEKKPAEETAQQQTAKSSKNQEAAEVKKPASPTKEENTQKNLPKEQPQTGSSSSANTGSSNGNSNGYSQGQQQRRHRRTRPGGGNNGGGGKGPHQPRDPRQQQEQNKPAEPGRIEELSLPELNQYARRLGIVGAGFMSKDQLLGRIKYVEAHPDMEMKVEGVLEKLPDGFGFLRSAYYDYVSGPDDVYVSPSQIRRFNLRTGDTVSGVIRKPKEGEKYFALLKIDKVNYEDPAALADRPHFDRLMPLHPDEKFMLEYDPTAISTRIMDMFTPIGKGQRGLIVAPPKVGKTLLLKDIAKSFIANHPESHLIVLLVDERPEEVSDMKRTLKGSSAEVISSTFDESPERHIQVVEIVLEKAKRMVESGRDVVILLDSITRLARAYNTMAPASGKVLTGGIDAHALQWPKRFFGAARNVEGAGSLTIIATAMVDTGSRMDEVIYEEFKGTGNMEMHMSRKLSNRRIYPAFDLLVSSTRRDDLLHTPDDLNKMWVLQKFLSTMSTIEGMEFLIDKMKKHKTNLDFLDSINKKPNGGQ